MTVSLINTFVSKHSCNRIKISFIVIQNYVLHQVCFIFIGAYFYILFKIIVTKGTTLKNFKRIETWKELFNRIRFKGLCYGLLFRNIRNFWLSISLRLSYELTSAFGKVLVLRMREIHVKKNLLGTELNPVKLTDCFV